MTVPQDTGELLHHVGELIGSERLNEAADVLRAASEREPANAIVLVTLGDVLARLGRTIPARRYYQRALERDAGDCVARVQLARLFAHQGDTAQAIEHYRQAITWRADTAPAYIELAALLAERGDQAGAIEMLSRLAERQPDSADALIALGDTLTSTRRFAEAEVCFRKALALSPQHPEYLLRLGASLREQDRFEEARVVLAQALRAAPHLAEAARQLAELHWNLGQREPALDVLREFVAQHPADFGVQRDFARRLESVGRDGEARTHYEAALALDPRSEEGVTALGLLELREGDQARGWLGAWLAARRDLVAENPAVAAPFDVELPRDLSGKTVLLLANGGLGNELFFLRYVQQLKARGARVLYRPSPEMHLLLRQRPAGLDAIIGPREALPPCHYTVYLAALPLALSRLESEHRPERKRRASHENRQHPWHAIPVVKRVFWPELPASLRLEPNAARLKFWRERLADMGKAPYTAITWRAGAFPEPDPLQHTGAAASMEAPIDALGKILGGCPGTLFSIQREPGPGETDRLSASAGRTVHDGSRANNDLEDVLALLALADEYVCVSNTHTDLRACVGHTAKVLVPWPPHWRWMAWGAESPWFPGFKVYRQQPDGNWARALTQLAGDLAAERKA